MMNIDNGGGANNATIKKTDYRSFRSFINSYGDKDSKDDQESVSSIDSGIFLSENRSNNTSPSRLSPRQDACPENNGKSYGVDAKAHIAAYENKFPANNANCNSSKIPTRAANAGFGSYKKYVEELNNKKFTSVKLSGAPKQNTVKSEIFIQVQETQPSQDTTACSDIPGDLTVENSQLLKVSINDNCDVQIDNSSTTSIVRAGAPPPPPPPPPPLPDLSFHPPRTCKTNRTAASELETTHPCPVQKLAKVPENQAAANLAQILTEHLKNRANRSTSTTNHKSNSAREAKNNTSKNLNAGNSEVDGCATKPPLLAQDLALNRVVRSEVNLIPAAPKLPEKTEFPKTKDIFTSSAPKPPANTAAIRKTSTPTSFKPDSVVSQHIRAFSPPPSPKSPSFVKSMTLNHKHKVNAIKDGQNAGFKSYKTPISKSFSVPNATSVNKAPSNPVSKLNAGLKATTEVDYSTTTVIPVTDSSAKLDKGDPNVKKLVYNTYRGLLGAYNNKANDMISTLPRNMVREDRGVAQQLESIALQGGLEKLNGRINPKTEQD